MFKSRKIKYCFWALWCIFGSQLSLAQIGVVFEYPLQGSLSEASGLGPLLIPLANSNGQQGVFATRNCPQGGSIQGYDFPFDAGLRFTLPANFLSSRSYTIQLTCKIDDLNNSFHDDISLISTRWDQDWGLFLHNPQGSLSQQASILPYPNYLNYPHPVGPANIDTASFFVYTLVRTAADSVKFYVNCQLVRTYYDNQLINIFIFGPSYLPNISNPYFTFFKDSPQQTHPEAAPGFVTNIKIANYVIPDSIIQAGCGQLCQTVLSQADFNAADEQFDIPKASITLFEKRLKVHITEDMSNLAVFDIRGKVLIKRMLKKGLQELDISHLSAGNYIAILTDGKGIIRKKIVLRH